MKALWLCVALVACGDELDPAHDTVACGEWPLFGGAVSEWTCERACVTQPENFGVAGEDMPCNASNPTRGSSLCNRTFEFAGQRGCCLMQPNISDPDELRFYVCD